MGAQPCLEPQRVSDRVPRGLDSEVSPAHPESWRRGVPEQTVSEAPASAARGRDRAPEYPAGPLPRGHGDPTPVRGERRHRAAEVPECESAEETVWVVRPGDWKENVAWSPGYFVSTVGVDEAKILAYVRWQERQDSGQAQLELF